MCPALIAISSTTFDEYFSLSTLAMVQSSARSALSGIVTFFSLSQSISCCFSSLTLDMNLNFSSDMMPVIYDYHRVFEKLLTK